MTTGVADRQREDAQQEAAQGAPDDTAPMNSITSGIRWRDRPADGDSAETRSASRLTPSPVRAPAGETAPRARDTGRRRRSKPRHPRETTPKIVGELRQPDDRPAPRPDTTAARRRPPATAAKAGASVAGASRLVSLDAFRGLTVAGMLLVNNAAVDDAVPAQFAHAATGKPITFADLIFPWFLFLVGVAIPFSAASRREAGKTRLQRALSVLQRAVVLFGIGVLLESSLDHGPVFSLGVLQLIALAYLVGRFVYRAPVAVRAAIAATLLGGYGAALLIDRVSSPLAHGIPPPHNLVQQINDTVFAPNHLDGLPSAVPTAALVILGSIAGDLLRRSKWSPWRRAGVLAVGGAALLVVGRIWSHFLVMDKPAWTPSYICFAAGWAAVGLALLYVLTDIGRVRAIVFPLVVFGANPLVAYAGAILFKIFILQGWNTHSPITGKAVSLQQGALDWCIRYAGDRVTGGWLYTAGYIALCWLVCLYLYRRNFLVRA